MFCGPESSWKNIMKGNKYFIDTNIFLRLIVKDDEQKRVECEKLITKIIQKKIVGVTSSIVIAEIVWTCLKLYRLNKEDVLEILESIGSIKNLKFRENIRFANALQFFKEYNVKFIDCLLASIPDIAEGRMAMISYDRDFDKIGIKRFEPGDLV